jgi:hypothetical protein
LKYKGLRGVFTKSVKSFRLRVKYVPLVDG